MHIFFLVLSRLLTSMFFKKKYFFEFLPFWTFMVVICWNCYDLSAATQNDLYTYVLGVEEFWILEFVNIFLDCKLFCRNQWWTCAPEVVELGGCLDHVTFTVETSWLALIEYSHPIYIKPLLRVNAPLYYHGTALFVSSWRWTYTSSLAHRTILTSDLSTVPHQTYLGQSYVTMLCDAWRGKSVCGVRLSDPWQSLWQMY